VRLRGASLAICGEVPQGAGLSSSAAIEVATALALLSAAGVVLSRKTVALLCQRAENEFVGARCGVMDQFIACFAREGHALLLDCRSLEFRLLPLPAGISIVIADTTVKHDLSAGEYNVRRQECEIAARMMGLRTLRDARLDNLGDHTLPISVLKRARHVIRENARTEAAAAALERGDLSTFGRLMTESHASLRDDYQVSCAELDAMVASAAGLEGLHGIRMTGGGFGGSTVSLVDDGHAARFAEALADRYRQATGLTPRIWVTPASGGAGEVQ
jgi:galactokinase